MSKADLSLIAKLSDPGFDFWEEALNANASLRDKGMTKGFKLNRALAKEDYAQIKSWARNKRFEVSMKFRRENNRELYHIIVADYSVLSKVDLSHTPALNVPGYIFAAKTILDDRTQALLTYAGAVRLLDKMTW